MIPEWNFAFPNGDRFDPIANFIENPNFVYATSFGEGPRQCPGRFLAESELRTVLASIMKNYTLRIPEDSPGVMHLMFHVDSHLLLKLGLTCHWNWCLSNEKLIYNQFILR